MGAIEIVFSWTADSFCFLGSGGISTMVGLDRVSTWLRDAHFEESSLLFLSRNLVIRLISLIYL